MNRILFDADERDGDEVRFGGARARHVWSVLGARAGDTIRAGEFGGRRHDAARIVANGPDECRILPGEALEPIPRAPFDLLLALPRPKCLRRLWPQIAALGPERVYVTAAEKVEKDYWGSTFLRYEVYAPLLREGIEQSGDTIVPAVEVHRRLKPLVEDVLPCRYAEGRRLVAHPARDGGDGDGPAPHGTPPPPPRADILPGGDGREERPGIVAVGPEGGWSDYELAMFERAGFRRVSLGARTLRTDTAVVALLALLALRA